MENQCLGLAERLSLQTRVFRLGSRRRGAGWRHIRLGSPFAHLARGSDVPAPPWPRLVDCLRTAEHSRSSRAIKRASGGVHARLCSASTRESSERVRSGRSRPSTTGLRGQRVSDSRQSQSRYARTPRRRARTNSRHCSSRFGRRGLAVLIGGANRAYRFGDAEARVLGDALRTLARDHGLMITASRRTGARGKRSCAVRSTGRTCFFWDGNGANPYLGDARLAERNTGHRRFGEHGVRSGGHRQAGAHLSDCPAAAENSRDFTRNWTARRFTALAGAIETVDAMCLWTKPAAPRRAFSTLLDARAPRPDMKALIEGP